MMEERLADRPNLREHLRAQLGQTRGSALVVQMARYLVEELDEHGYLRTAPEEIAELLHWAHHNPVINGAVLHANLGQKES